MSDNRKEKFVVLDPNFLYHGRSYSDYTTDWFNWFLSSNADDRNSGPVVFLRSKGIPNRATQSYELEVSTKTTVTNSTPDQNYPYPYLNEPNIRIGADKLQIFKDQAVFVPLIVAYDYCDLPYKDWGYLQEFCGATIDNGDNPPDLIQLTINNKALTPDDLPGRGEDFSEFRIATPIFTAVVPEAPYGTTVKDFLEMGSLPAGFYQAMITGYFVMLKFEPGTYWIHSWASAGREVKGPYFSELLYQIDVGVRPAGVPHHRITVTRPARFQALAKKAAEHLTTTNPSDLKCFTDIDNTLNGRLNQSLRSKSEQTSL